MTDEIENKEEFNVDELKVQLLMFGHNVHSLEQSAKFLTKRGWPTTVVTQVNDVIRSLIDQTPDLVLLSASHPHPAAQKLPDMILQNFNIPCVSFLEAVDTKSMANQQRSRCRFKLQGAASGPNLHRGLRKILDELFNPHFEKESPSSSTSRSSSEAQNDSIRIGGKSPEDRIEVRSSESQNASSSFSFTSSENGDGETKRFQQESDGSLLQQIQGNHSNSTNTQKLGTKVDLEELLRSLDASESSEYADEEKTFALSDQNDLSNNFENSVGPTIASEITSSDPVTSSDSVSPISSSLSDSDRSSSFAGQENSPQTHHLDNKSNTISSQSELHSPPPPPPDASMASPSIASPQLAEKSQARDLSSEQQELENFFKKIDLSTEAKKTLGDLSEITHLFAAEILCNEKIGVCLSLVEWTLLDWTKNQKSTNFTFTSKKQEFQIPATTNDRLENFYLQNATHFFKELDSSQPLFAVFCEDRLPSFLAQQGPLLSFSINDLQGVEKLLMPLHIHLEKNQKMLKYVDAGGILLRRQFDALIKQNIETFVSKSDHFELLVHQLQSLFNRALAIKKAG